MPITKRYETKGVRVLHITQPDSGDAGHVLWPASEYFSRYLEAKPTRFPIRGKRWIELGAGCGLIGLVLKHLAAAEVTITDLAPIVPNLRVNAQSNFSEDLSSGALKIKALDWGSMTPAEWGAPYDGIVASDVLYLPQYFDALIQCMRVLSSTRTVILLTGFIRGSQSHDRWVEAARSFFNVTTVVEKKCVDDDGDDTAGLQHHETWFILKLTKKEEVSTVPPASHDTPTSSINVVSDPSKALPSNNVMIHVSPITDTSLASSSVEPVVRDLHALSSDTTLEVLNNANGPNPTLPPCQLKSSRNAKKGKKGKR